MAIYTGCDVFAVLINQFLSLRVHLKSPLAMSRCPRACIVQTAVDAQSTSPLGHTSPTGNNRPTGNQPLTDCLAPQALVSLLILPTALSSVWLFTVRQTEVDHCPDRHTTLPGRSSNKWHRVHQKCSNCSWLSLSILAGNTIHTHTHTQPDKHNTTAITFLHSVRVFLHLSWSPVVVLWSTKLNYGLV